MGSAWGKSWGLSWGGAWGAVTAPVMPHQTFFEPGGDDDNGERQRITRNNQNVLQLVAAFVSSGALE